MAKDMEDSSAPSVEEGHFSSPDGKDTSEGKGFTGLIEKRLFPILMTLSRIKLLHSIRESVIWSIPLLVAGFCVIFYLMGPGTSLSERGLRSFSSAMGLLGFSVVFLIPFFHSRKGSLLRAVTSGLFALLCFVVLLPVQSFSPQEVFPLLMLLSRGGMVVAFLLGGLLALSDEYLAPRLERSLFWKTRIAAFVVIALPLIIYRSLFSGVFQWVDRAIIPLLSGADSLPAAVLVVALMCLFWLVGIHGSGLVGGIVLPFYIVAFNANLAAHSAGQPMPYIITPPFFIWCLIGGTGATLPLCVYMMFSRSRHLRKVGYVSILPSLININEPLLFGTPLILNPMVAVPFVLVPVILAVVNYGAIYSGLVGRIYLFPPFTLPAPLYAYLSNLDFRSAILLTADIAIAALIYHPFFKALEKVHLMKESSENITGSGAR